MYYYTMVRLLRPSDIKRRRPVAQNVKKYVNRRIKGSFEMKRQFMTTAVADANNTPVITDLTAIAQGDTQFSRDGDGIALNSINLNILCRAAIDNVVGECRIFVISTRVEGTPVLGDFLQDVSFPLVMYSQYKERPMLAKVLFDRHVVLDTDTSTGSRAKLIKIRLDHRQLPARLDFDNGATTAPKNKVWLLTIGHPNTSSVTTVMKGIVRFKDI